MFFTLFTCQHFIGANLQTAGETDKTQNIIYYYSKQNFGWLTAIQIYSLRSQLWTLKIEKKSASNCSLASICHF